MFMLHLCPPQELSYINRVNDVQYEVNMGFVPNMRVPGTFYVNDRLKGLLFEELQQHVARGEVQSREKTRQPGITGHDRCCYASVSAQSAAVRCAVCLCAAKQ